MQHAWLTVALVSCALSGKRLPSLDDLMSKGTAKSKQQQSDAEMTLMLQLMSARTGIPLEGAA